MLQHQAADSLCISSRHQGCARYHSFDQAQEPLLAELIEAAHNSDSCADTVGDQYIQRLLKLVILKDGGLQGIFGYEWDSDARRFPEPPVGGGSQEVLECNTSNALPDLRPARIDRKIGDGCVRQSFNQQSIRLAAVQ